MNCGIVTEPDMVNCIEVWECLQRDSTKEKTDKLRKYISVYKIIKIVHHCRLFEQI